MKQSRFFGLVTVALLCFQLPKSAIASQEAGPSLGQSISIEAGTWNDVRMVDRTGNVLLTVRGASLGSPLNARAVGGKVSRDGDHTVVVDYQLQPAPPGISLKGYFTEKHGRVDVRLELSGTSATATKANLHWQVGKGALAKGVDKLGLWQRHPQGGVPVEVPDGSLLRWQIGNDSLSLAFTEGTKVTPDWQGRNYAPLRLTPSSQRHFATSLSILIADAQTPPEIIAARWHERALGLHLGTDHVYNWWTDNKAPLQVKPLLANTSTRQHIIDYNSWVRNYAGEVVAKDSRTITLKPGEAFSEPISAKAAERDLLFVEVSAKDHETGKEIFSRTNMAVLPPYAFKSTADNSLFGLSAAWPLPTQKDAKRLMQRMGVRWLRDGDTRQYADIGIVANCFKSSIPNLPQPKRDQFIRQFLAKCVEQHNPYWEMLNEINFAGGGIGMGDAGIGKATAVDGYVQWLRDIRRVQKETGMTQVKLMSAGMAGMDKVFLEKFHAAGGWGLVDAIALHPGRGNFTADYGLAQPYAGWQKGASGNYWNFYGSVRSAQRMMAKYGSDKGLWLTEMYALAMPNRYWSDTPRGQAENVFLQYALAASEGVKVAMFYQLFDSVWSDRLGVDPNNREYFFGLVNRDMSFKPGLLAYCAIAEALDQAQFARALRFNEANVRGLLFSSPKGSFAVLWDRADGYEVTKKNPNFVSPEAWQNSWKTKAPTLLPANGASVTVVNSIGQRSKVVAQNRQVRIELSGAPIIVYGLDASRMEGAGAKE